METPREDHVAKDKLNSEDLENSVKKDFYLGRI